MLLRSGFEYLYSAPSTSSSRANANRKRKAVDDSLNERPLKRQDTSLVLQGEPSNASLPASRPISLSASPPTSLSASSPVSLSASPLDSLSVSPTASAHASVQASVPASVHASVQAFVPASPSASVHASVSGPLSGPVPGSLSGSLPGPAPGPLSGSLPATLPGSLPAPSPSSLKGKIIGGEIHLLNILGEGGNACVYLGLCPQDRAYFAVKVLPKPTTVDPSMEVHLVETDIQQSLQHANLVALHRVLQDQDFLYLAMEFCNQGDLFDYVYGDNDEVSVPHEQMVKLMFSQILSGIEHMHSSGVYHGDLKLENIFLQNDGNEQDVVCKVGDFGFATRQQFSTDFGRGTYSFNAPELLDAGMRNRPYDAAASDVWSLGVILLLMLFRVHVPWEEASDDNLLFRMFKRTPSVLTEQLFPNLSAATAHLVQGMLAINAADRPSVTQIKEQFSAIDRFFVDDAGAHF